MEDESVPVRQPSDQLHDGLTAYFGHAVEEDDLLVRSRCVVQLTNVKLEIKRGPKINLKTLKIAKKNRIIANILIMKLFANFYSRTT